MNGFEKRKAKKETDILQASISLFMKYGIKKVSIAEIAKEANVSQVTIYNYFGNKDQLVEHALTYYINQIWEEYNEIINSDLPYKEKIKHIILKKSLTGQKIHEGLYEKVMTDFTNDRGALKGYQEKAMPMIMNLFNEGKEKGYIDPAISNEAIIIYCQMFITYMQREADHINMLKHAEGLTKLFFYGIFGEEKYD